MKDLPVYSQPRLALSRLPRCSGQDFWVFVGVVSYLSTKNKLLGPIANRQSQLQNYKISTLKQQEHINKTSKIQPLLISEHGQDWHWWP